MRRRYNPIQEVLLRQEDAMAKKTTKGQSNPGKARRKLSKTKDLPVDRRAKSVKGGAFSSPITGAGLRNTVGGNRNTVGGSPFRNTI